MSEIIKTEAVVLNKLNYGDTSKIASLFTKDEGKISVIIKGGRSPKSKIGRAVDPLNYLQVLFYKKDTREVQILSGADIISHYSKIKEDLEKLKYSSAILELVKKLTPEHEENQKLFKGLVKILNLINLSNEEPDVLFGRFFVFFLSDLGYELQLNKCSICGKANLKDEDLAYNFELGILCCDCKDNYQETFHISRELFLYLNCLRHNKLTGFASGKLKERANNFLEKYLKYHVADFKGIKSFQLYN